MLLQPPLLTGITACLLTAAFDAVTTTNAPDGGQSLLFRGPAEFFPSVYGCMEDADKVGTAMIGDDCSGVMCVWRRCG